MVFGHSGTPVPLSGLAGDVYVALVDFGFAGVDLFFVLSGFLITRILLRTRESRHYLRNFYARRTLRIFPAYYLWLAFLLVAVPGLGLFAGWGLEMQGGASPLWYWLYASNFGVAAYGHWLHPQLSIAWSLAIEEQFYLVWPWVVRACSPRRLAAVCVACLVAAPLLRTGLFLADVSPLVAFALTPCRFDALAAGALVAALAADPARVPGLLRFARISFPVALLSVVALVAVLEAGWLPPGPRGELEHQPLMYTAGYSLLAWLFTSGLILAALSHERRGAWLGVAPLRVFGRYSYALYLTHLFVGSLVVVYVMDPREYATVLGGLSFYAVLFSAQLLVAWLSWVLVESHFLRWKARFSG